jgi:hypothetical protein
MKRCMALLVTVVLLVLNAAIFFAQATSNARDVVFEATVNRVMLTPRPKAGVVEPTVDRGIESELYRQGYIPIGSLSLSWVVAADEVDVVAAGSDEEVGNYLLWPETKAKILQALQARAATAGGDLVQMTGPSIVEGDSTPREGSVCTGARPTSNGRDTLCVSFEFGVKSGCRQTFQSRKGTNCVAWYVIHDPARSKKVSLVTPVWRLEPELVRGWHDYSYPEDGIAIFAPSKPVFQRDTLGTAQYVINLGGDQTIRITIDPRPLFLDTGFLRNHGRRMLDGRNYKITSDREIERAGYKGVELEAQGVEASGGQRVKLRYLAVKGKLFTLSHFGSTDTPVPVARDRIFDSLMVIDNPPGPTAGRSLAPPPPASPTPATGRSLKPLPPADTAVPSAGGWQEYSYPEYGFSISAPFKPDFWTDAAGGNYLIKLTPAQQITISVHPHLTNSVKDMGLVKMDTRRSFLESNVNITSEREITWAGHQGFEWEGLGKKARVKMRFLRVKGKDFILHYFGLLDAPVPAERDRIFDSLKFLADSPSSPVKAPAIR